MSVKLLTEHQWSFLAQKEAVEALVKMSNCWKSHAAAHL